MQVIFNIFKLLSQSCTCQHTLILEYNLRLHHTGPDQFINLSQDKQFITLGFRKQVLFEEQLSLNQLFFLHKNFFVTIIQNIFRQNFCTCYSIGLILCSQFLSALAISLSTVILENKATTSFGRHESIVEGRLQCGLVNYTCPAQHASTYINAYNLFHRNII